MRSLFLPAVFLLLSGLAQADTKSPVVTLYKYITATVFTCSAMEAKEHSTIHTTESTQSIPSFLPFPFGPLAKDCGGQGENHESKGFATQHCRLCALQGKNPASVAVSIAIDPADGSNSLRETIRESGPPPVQKSDINVVHPNLSSEHHDETSLRAEQASSTVPIIPSRIQAASTTEPTASPIYTPAVEELFRVLSVPDLRGSSESSTRGQNNTLRRRQNPTDLSNDNSTFVSSNGIQASGKGQASLYYIFDGELFSIEPSDVELGNYSAAFPISLLPDTPVQPFIKSQQVRGVSTTFTRSADSIVWTNETFVGGDARFCVLEGQYVLVVVDGSTPDECAMVNLGAVAYDGPVAATSDAFLIQPISTTTDTAHMQSTSPYLTTVVATETSAQADITTSADIASGTTSDIAVFESSSTTRALDDVGEFSGPLSTHDSSSGSSSRSIIHTSNPDTGVISHGSLSERGSFLMTFSDTAMAASTTTNVNSATDSDASQVYSSSRGQNTTPGTAPSADINVSATTGGSSTYSVAFSSSVAFASVPVSSKSSIDVADVSLTSSSYASNRPSASSIDVTSASVTPPAEPTSGSRIISDASAALLLSPSSSYIAIRTDDMSGQSTGTKSALYEGSISSTRPSYLPTIVSQPTSYTKVADGVQSTEPVTDVTSHDAPNSTSSVSPSRFATPYPQSQNLQTTSLAATSQEVSTFVASTINQASSDATDLAASPVASSITVSGTRISSSRDQGMHSTFSPFSPFLSVTTRQNSYPVIVATTDASSGSYTSSGVFSSTSRGHEVASSPASTSMVVDVETTSGTSPMSLPIASVVSFAITFDAPETRSTAQSVADVSLIESTSSKLSASVTNMLVSSIGEAEVGPHPGGSTFPTSVLSEIIIDTLSISAIMSATSSPEALAASTEASLQLSSPTSAINTSTGNLRSSGSFAATSERTSSEASVIETERSPQTASLPPLTYTGTKQPSDQLSSTIIFSETSLSSEVSIIVTGAIPQTEPSSTASSSGSGKFSQTTSTISSVQSSSSAINVVDSGVSSQTSASLAGISTGTEGVPRQPPLSITISESLSSSLLSSMTASPMFESVIATEHTSQTSFSASSLYIYTDQLTIWTSSTTTSMLVSDVSVTLAESNSQTISAVSATTFVFASSEQLHSSSSMASLSSVPTQALLSSSSTILLSSIYSVNSTGSFSGSSTVVTVLNTTSTLSDAYDSVTTSLSATGSTSYSTLTMANGSTRPTGSSTYATSDSGDTSLPALRLANASSVLSGASLGATLTSTTKFNSSDVSVTSGGTSASTTRSLRFSTSTIYGTSQDSYSTRIQDDLLIIIEQYLVKILTITTYVDQLFGISTIPPVLQVGDAAGTIYEVFSALTTTSTRYDSLAPLVSTISQVGNQAGTIIEQYIESIVTVVVYDVVSGLSTVPQVGIVPGTIYDYYSRYSVTRTSYGTLPDYTSIIPQVRSAAATVVEQYLQLDPVTVPLYQLGPLVTSVVPQVGRVPGTIYRLFSPRTTTVTTYGSFPQLYSSIIPQFEDQIGTVIDAFPVQIVTISTYGLGNLVTSEIAQVGAVAGTVYKLFSPSTITSTVYSKVVSNYLSTITQVGNTAGTIVEVYLLSTVTVFVSAINGVIPSAIAQAGSQAGTIFADINIMTSTIYGNVPDYVSTFSAAGASQITVFENYLQRYVSSTLYGELGGAIGTAVSTKAQQGTQPAVYVYEYLKTIVTVTQIGGVSLPDVPQVGSIPGTSYLRFSAITVTLTSYGPVATSILVPQVGSVAATLTQVIPALVQTLTSYLAAGSFDVVTLVPQLGTVAATVVQRISALPTVTSLLYGGLVPQSTISAIGQSGSINPIVIVQYQISTITTFVYGVTEGLLGTRSQTGTTPAIVSYGYLALPTITVPFYGNFSGPMGSAIVQSGTIAPTITYGYVALPTITRAVFGAVQSVLTTIGQNGTINPTVIVQYQISTITSFVYGIGTGILGINSQTGSAPAVATLGFPSLVPSTITVYGAQAGISVGAQVGGVAGTIAVTLLALPTSTTYVLRDLGGVPSSLVGVVSQSVSVAPLATVALDIGLAVCITSTQACAGLSPSSVVGLDVLNVVAIVTTYVRPSSTISGSATATNILSATGCASLATQTVLPTTTCALLVAGKIESASFPSSTSNPVAYQKAGSPKSDGLVDDNTGLLGIGGCGVKTSNGCGGPGGLVHVYRGYFVPLTTGRYTFSATTGSGSLFYLWLGALAYTGWTASNANLSSSGANSTFSVPLLALNYYPIRWFYNDPGALTAGSYNLQILDGLGLGVGFAATFQPCSLLDAVAPPFPNWNDEGGPARLIPRGYVFQ